MAFKDHTRRILAKDFAGGVDTSAPPFAMPDKKAGRFALGRLPTGTLNKTEQAYADYLEQQRRLDVIAWFRFEGIKLRLADNTFYSPDFAVMGADGTLEMHEVKG